MSIVGLLDSIFSYILILASVVHIEVPFVSTIGMMPLIAMARTDNEVWFFALTRQCHVFRPQYCSPL